MITTILIFTGLMLVAYWATYVMGNPLADHFDPTAIASGIPYWLAARRLARAGMLAGILKAQAEELAFPPNAVERRKLVVDHRRYLISQGRELFTWERSFLCPICFHWWLTVLVAAFMIIFNWLSLPDAGLAAFVYLFSHLIIRKIS